MDLVPDPLLFRKSGSAENRIRDLWISSQKLWPLDHRGCRRNVSVGNYTLNSTLTCNSLMQYLNLIPSTFSQALSPSLFSTRTCPKFTLSVFSSFHLKTHGCECLLCCWPERWQGSLFDEKLIRGSSVNSLLVVEIVLLTSVYLMLTTRKVLVCTGKWRQVTTSWYRADSIYMVYIMECPDFMS
jgi:hypothetical protein